MPMLSVMTKIEAIEWAGGTQDDLAAKLGIKQPSIANWGEFPPPIRQLQIQRLSRGRLKAEPGVLSPLKAPAKAA